MNRYFDNGSTSFPKPKAVTDAISDFITNIGGSYGRSSHGRAFTTTSLIEECRDLVGEKLGLEDGSNIAWAKNATEASNIILSSLDLRGKRVLVSPLEHNCIMRPLEALGAIIEVMPSFADGRVDIANLKRGDYTLAIVNHQSNVNGVIQPVKEIKSILGDTPMMVDTAQSLGHIDVNISDWNIDYAIFTGHKGLLGITGVGGLYSKDTNVLKTLIYGGTGSNSASFEMPKQFPEFLEAGTYNSVGIIGLLAALKSKKIINHSKGDFLDMISGMRSLDGIEIFSADNGEYQGELFSFRHSKIDGAKITSILNDEYGIECRYGLHCSPLAHSKLGTTESGTIRVAPSMTHTPQELMFFVEVVSEIINKFK